MSVWAFVVPTHFAKGANGWEPGDRRLGIGAGVGQSPLCDAPYSESSSMKKLREATIANSHISCGIGIPIETGPPHP